jgi:uncharacterized LabA/DUF88 family protein
VKYLFVDGGFLDAMLEKPQKYFGRPSELEYRYEFIAGGYARTFYYDAYPQKKKTHTEEEHCRRLAAKERKFRKINLTPGVHTREGITRNRTAGESRLQQKGVDILLAIDVFKHAINGNMTETHIMTTDIDFFPLFDALRDTRVSTHLHCYPRETSEELMFLADRVVPVTAFTVLRWCGAASDGDRLVTWNVPCDQASGLPLCREGSLKNGFFRMYRRESNEETTFYAHIEHWNPQYVVSSVEERFITDDIEAHLQEMILF